MKKIIIFVYTFFVITVIPAMAVTNTATPSATPQTSITPSETRDIQEKIKTLVKENLSATESNLKEKINLKTLVGYIGKINAINSGNITIDSRENALIQITTNEQTAITKAGSQIKLSSLALSDKVIILGTLLKDDIVLAKRILVVQDETSPIISSTIVAKISSIDTKKKTISLNVNNEELTYSLTKKSTIVLGDLKPGQTIFAIAKKYDGKNLLSRAKVI